jgi:hypothetical protein
LALEVPLPHPEEGRGYAGGQDMGVSFLPAKSVLDFARAMKVGRPLLDQKDNRWPRLVL